MVEEIKGTYDGAGLDVGIVLAEFNDFITTQLKQGALETLEKCGVETSAITICRAPGSFEIPGLARQLAESGEYDGIICLGAVVRGETAHFEYVSSEVTRGVGKLNYSSDIPVVFGVITADTLEQAVDRAGVKAGNKGAEAARTLVQQTSVYNSL